MACSLSGVGLRSCQCGIFSAVRLEAAESWDEFWFLQVRITWVYEELHAQAEARGNEGTDLSGRVSFKCFTLGVVGASFEEDKSVSFNAWNPSQRWKNWLLHSPWKLPPSEPWGCYILGGRGAWPETAGGAGTSQTGTSLPPKRSNRRLKTPTRQLKAEPSDREREMCHLVHVDLQWGPRRGVPVRLQGLEQSLGDVQIICRTVRGPTSWGTEHRDGTITTDVR